MSDNQCACCCCGCSSSISQDEANNKFKTWCAALSTGYQKWVDAGRPHDDSVAQGVADNYQADDALLLPTVKYMFASSVDLIRSYFGHFVTSNPKGVITKQDFHSGPSIAVQGGDYTFTLTNAQTGAVNDVACDFTYIMRRNAKGGLDYVHHHSSTKAHAADDTVFATMADEMAKAYAAVQSTGPSATVFANMADKKIRDIAEASGCEIRLGQQAIKDLGDGFLLYAGHMTVTRGGVSAEHRFTMAFDKDCRCIRQQFSKNPENPVSTSSAKQVA